MSAITWKDWCFGELRTTLRSSELDELKIYEPKKFSDGIFECNPVLTPHPNPERFDWSTPVLGRSNVRRPAARGKNERRCGADVLTIWWSNASPAKLRPAVFLRCCARGRAHSDCIVPAKRMIVSKEI
jgi:hypothetical protein